MRKQVGQPDDVGLTREQRCRVRTVSVPPSRGQIALVGWSAGGVSVVETLNDEWRTTEGFAHFPKVRVSLSGDWAFTQSIAMNTSNDSVLAQVYFDDDPTFMDDIYVAQFEENCSSMSSRGVPCSSFRLQGTYHDLWLSSPDGSPGPWGDPVTDCFAGTPTGGCSPMTQILPFAADATSPR